MKLGTSESVRSTNSDEESEGVIGNDTVICFSRKIKSNKMLRKDSKPLSTIVTYELGLNWQ